MSASSLATIQTQMNFYAYPILMVLGSIGNIFILIVFNRQRQNACSIYLTHSTIINLLYLGSAGFLKLFIPSYYYQTLGALILCKFSNYTLNFLGQVARTIFILACIDRYMITSNRARLRAFSTPKRAKYFISFSYIVWLVVASHTLIWTTTINGQCTKTGIYATFYTFYTILFVGFIPSVIICVFGYLTYRNMRQLRTRIQPTGQNTNNANNYIQRRDRDLLVLVIAEAFVYMITTNLFPVVLLETTISSYVVPNKSLQYLRTEIFALNFAFLLLSVYSAAPFYIYMISSKSFRREFKQLITDSYRKVAWQAPDQPALRTAQRITQRDTRL